LRYSYSAEAIEAWIKEGGVRRLLIQAPPGLKKTASEIAMRISGAVREVIHYGGSCWGGCDVAFRAAREAGADGILHLGHARFLDEEPIPTYYLECRVQDSRPLEKALEKAGLLKGFRRVGVGGVVQWLDLLDLVERRLRGLGIEVEIGEPIPPLRHRGQVLGCSYGPLLEMVDADCFLVIGSRFHGLGLALQSWKPVYVADPESQLILDLGREVERILRSRYAYIERFSRSRRIGVIVSIKPGQFRMGLASRLVERLREEGFEADILLLDDVAADSLRDEVFDAFVNTACPRLSIDDQERFEKPLLLPMEALVAVGEAEWEEVIRTPRYMSMEVL